MTPGSQADPFGGVFLRSGQCGALGDRSCDLGECPFCHGVEVVANAVLVGMNGLAAIRARDCLTSAAGSRKDSGAHPGRSPVSASICALNSSSVKVSMPQAGSLSWVHHGRQIATASW